MAYETDGEAWAKSEWKMKIETKIALVIEESRNNSLCRFSHRQKLAGSLASTEFPSRRWIGGTVNVGPVGLRCTSTSGLGEARDDG